MSDSHRALPRQRLSRWIRWVPWIVGLGCLVAVLPIRLSAHSSDFALANVLTDLMGFAAWLMFSLGLMLSRGPRWIWQSFFFGPLVAVGVFLLIYRFERVDGELKPQFSSRWSSTALLPSRELPLGRTPDSRIPALPTELLQPKPTDFPQFLGPHRDATLTTPVIDSNWRATPPQIAWQQEIGDGWSGFAVQGDVAVTMEQRLEQEWVSIYSVLDGSLLWEYAIAARHSNVMGGTGPRSTPSIADGKVYAASAVSRIVCLELSSGNEVWSQELLELAGTNQMEFEKKVSWGRSASPLLVDDKVVIPLGGVDATTHTLIAFDRHSGDEIWRTGTDQISYSSPCLATLRGVRQILYLSETQLAGYAIDSGELLWSTPWPGSSSGAASVSQPVVVDDAHILVSKGYGEGAQYLEIQLDADAWSVQTLWTNKTSLRTKFTSCVVKDGFAYGLSDGILECVRLEDGKKQWKNGRYRQGQLLLVGDLLLITSEGGEIVLVRVDPRDFDELARFPVIGDVSWNTPALSGNRLLMRNSDEAACVLLPLKN